MIAYIGIGSNLGDRAAYAERALREIATLGGITGVSSFYRTAPWGNPNQPWYLNAVVAIETALSPRVLLERLRAIESSMGRVRGERWAPRTIDLDLLLYDDLELDEPGLRVPHPYLRERAFVLVPLAEIDGRFAPLRDALAESELAGVARVERENITEMPEREVSSVVERIGALARFLSESGAARVRIERGDDAIEVAAGGRRRASSDGSRGDGAPESGSARVDTIKADLVGIFHLSRPAPAEGETVDGDRELGFIEALGIRTPVHSTDTGRIVSIAATDGAPVEYGQALFLISRGH
ncbi:MAG: 2-amino-4-hydroxy-6-hydroxymethyldihydropteridine diphosphokinase [Candidatus Eremiobacteraeota bacterium]|nr:2-amino-4-hydroxy-6-hydroxymethyldihydropteridine diphosphokinase [Candidatus Eremiobacteraeota bacterium]